MTVTITEHVKKPTYKYFTLFWLFLIAGSFLGSGANENNNWSFATVGSLILLTLALFYAFATVYAVFWWKPNRKKRSRKFWFRLIGLTASILVIMFGVWGGTKLYHHSHSIKGGNSTTQASYRTGAICRDGWQSSATGSGACSHHGGVDYWLYN